MIKRVKNCDKKVTIGLVGKYVELEDAYLSVAEALRHGGFENAAEVDIKWLQSEDINSDTVADILKDCDGIIVPGGFGDRGIEKVLIESIKYARENKIPMFGICLGMQMSVIEYAADMSPGLKMQILLNSVKHLLLLSTLWTNRRISPKKAVQCDLDFIHVN